MTEAEALALEAGPETDLLIARLFPDLPGVRVQGPPWSTDSCWQARWRYNGGYSEAFCPSADWAAMGLLVEHLRSLGWWWQIESRGGMDGDWEVWADHRDDPEGSRVICWHAAKPQLGVCRVAAVIGLRRQAKGGVG